MNLIEDIEKALDSSTLDHLMAQVLAIRDELRETRHVLRTLLSSLADEPEEEKPVPTLDGEVDGGPRDESQPL